MAEYAGFTNYATDVWEGYEKEVAKVHAYHKMVSKTWKEMKDKGKEVAWLRSMCRNDLYFLLVYVLGRSDFSYIVDKDTGERIERPWIFERCREVQAEPDGYLDIWARDHYKDLADDTPVWTTEGWKTQGTLEVGDYVMTPNGPSKVVAVRHFTDSHCKKINFKGGVSIVCGNGHLWKVNCYNTKRVCGNKRVGWEEKVIETGDIHIVKSKHPYISVPKPYAGTKSDLPIAPYLLGVWLGDGDNTSGRVTNEDKEIWDRIAALGYEVSKDNNRGLLNAQTRTVYKILPKLKELGVFCNKHIPTQYLCASYEDRLELFRGLMDTDGSITKRKDGNTCTFTQKRYEMVRDFIALATSLGFRCRTTKCKTNFNTEAYYVQFSARPDLPSPFYLSKKSERLTEYEPQKQSANWYIQSVEDHETVPTTCIQVEDPEGMYFCTHYWIQTHNSSIITYGKTIQDILINPEITICIYAYNVGLAQKMLKQIKNTFESCGMLKTLFPDILYKDEHQTGWKDEKGNWHKRKWSEEAITVMRRTNPKESTLECSGLVEGQRTGGHYNLLIYDDTVTIDSVRTKEQIKKTTEAFFMSLNTGSSGNLKIRMIGTRYHLNDTYKDVLSKGYIKARVYPCFHLDDKGRLTDEPVLYTRSLLEMKRTNSAYGVFETQMLCNPMENATGAFAEEWISYTDEVPDNMNIAIICDPAGSQKTRSDFTVYWVVGRTAEDNFIFLDLVRDKMDLDQKWMTLRAMVSQYTKNGRKPMVFYEQVSMQSDIQHFNYRMKEERSYIDITPVSGKPKLNYNHQMSGVPVKDQRIGALVPLFKAHRIFFTKIPPRYSYFEKKDVNMLEDFLEDEYKAYPFAKHDDGLDCMSRIADLETGLMLVKPDLNKKKKHEKKGTADFVNSTLGYVPY